MKWLPLVALLVGGIVLALRHQAQIMLGVDEAQLASLLIGITLITFIGTSILAGYRGHLGRFARQLAAVVVVGIGLAGGYSYKSEVAALANRISDLMPPGEPVSSEPRQAGEKAVKVKRRSDGHFVARVNVGGVPVNALIDTGASTVVLRAADAKSVGLDTEKLAYTVPVQTANGLAYAAAVRLHTLAIGSIVVEGVDALVARPGALKESLLGISFLRRLRSYEFTGDYLTLRG